MSIKRQLNEFCPKCGERQCRIDGGWVYWHPCCEENAVPGPPDYPRRYREGEVIINKQEKTDGRPS